MTSDAPEIRFDTYYSYTALTERLQSLTRQYPHLLKMDTAGKSFEGRDVWVVTATNFATGPAEDKPAFWADGNIHATEVSASSACLYALHKLATGYGTDPDVTRAMDTRAFYIVPRVNPDGAELYLQDTPKFLRSSTRPYPYDEEPLEGLRLDDVDGDGRFLQMRVPDPNGPWKVSVQEPRLLTRRDPAESGGTYYRLLPEGVLDNYDGLTITIQKNKQSLDLNRNFPSQWRQEGEQAGAGPFPGSEPEVYNLVKWITSHPNITGGLTFHTYSGVLLRPFGTAADDTMPAEDLWTFQHIGKKGTELTGYPNISVYHDFRYHPKEVITGVFDDWLYDHLGVYAWTVEIWSPQRQAGIIEGFDKDTKQGAGKFTTWWREHPFEDDLKMLRWSDEKLDGKGYIDWYAFDHPQLGPVEIGGWNGWYAFRNPPPPMLEAEIAPLADWLIWNALISPKLEIAHLTATPLAQQNDVKELQAYLIRLVVDNTGWLPTNISKKALERKVVRGVVAEIELPDGATLESGKARLELGQLEGRALKGSAPSTWTADPTTDRAKTEWIVRAAPGSTVKVTARHERAGTVRAEVTIGS